MRRVWHVIRTHRLSAALFGLFWLTMTVITVVLWPHGVPDQVGWVPHAVMALCAGALVAYWRNAEVDALGVSAVVGALIGGLNICVQGVAFAVERWLANSPPVIIAAPAPDEEPGWLFIVVLITIMCVIGGVLGILGWVVSSILMLAGRRLRGRGRPAAPTGLT